ncbi:DUF3100 domain-containing protein [Leucobacter sp. wl10]|uniref:DUF3100 domain-containing protein n=1 Tax=Leucobacter sp. wl10 TaxID=2304677 RepID=UPI000E5B5DC6|nr:DUF3100 domain-containing protein [Leucobacter sp. wl10]RGE23241.1 DUF3100 domain-containing protein [Leucobacter sp. wl10]
MTKKTAAAQAPAPAAGVRNEFAISFRNPLLWLLIGLMAAVAVAAQLIGPAAIPVGAASITLLPMIWALLLGVIISGQRVKPLPVNVQHTANAIMAVAVLLLCARLSLTLGPNLPFLLEAGPALLLQELGNVFGTILLALPLAVLLRMGPATVGATFSIDREPSFAMVTERFGMNSPQYRGVLSMYVFGSIFGAIIVSLVASLASSAGVFDWRALAMGAGVGSGSMMAAGAASVTAAHPGQAEQVLALATTSNLIASIFGVYLSLWISLPLADRFYRFLTRGRAAKAPKPTGGLVTERVQTVAAAVLEAPRVRIPLWNVLLILSGVGVAVAIAAAKSFSIDMIVTYAILSLFVAGAMWLSRLTRGKVPALVIIITVGTLATSPICPIAPWLLEVSASVDFLSVITMMLAIAGLSIGKDLPMLKEIGWKIIPVGIVVIAATYLGSTLIAQLVLGIIG